MSNYLTTNPVFKLAKHDNDLAWRYYFDEKTKLQQELDSIKLEQDTEEFKYNNNEEVRQRKYKNSNAKKNVYARYKSKVKQRIITIIREIELKNLEYTKNLVIILGKYRNIYTKIIIDERDNDNRIHQMEQEVGEVGVSDEPMEQMEQEVGEVGVSDEPMEQMEQMEQPKIDNVNRIHQMEQMEQPKIDNVNDNTECPFLWNNNKEEIEINQNDEIQMAENKSQ